MIYTDNDRAILQTRIDAIHGWINIYRNDKAYAAVGAVNQVLETDLLEIRRIRWFSIAGDDELSLIWHRYFDNEAVSGEARESLFDFYAQGVQFMEMMAPVASGHLESFHAHLARSVTWPERTSVIGNVVQENTSTYSNLLAMIKNNPWVVFLIVLGMMDVKV